MSYCAAPDAIALGPLGQGAPGTTVSEVLELRLARTRITRWGLGFAGLVTVVTVCGLAAGLKAALVLLTAAGFAAAVLGVFWPVPGLLGIGILCTIDSLTRVYLMKGNLLRWNTFNYWLLLVMLLSLPLLMRLRDPHSRVLQALLLLLVAELSFSPDVKLGMLHVLNGGVMFGLLVYLLRGARLKAAWYWFALVNGLLSCGIGMIFYLRPGDLTISDPNSIVPGALATIDANALSQSLLTAMFTIVMACAIRAGSARGVMLLGVLAVADFCWIFLSGSRSSTALAACCLLFLMAIIPGLVRRAVFMGIAGLVGLAILWQFPAFQERMLGRLEKMRGSGFSATQRSSGRWDLAVGAWNIFLQHPFGVGTGGCAREIARLEGVPGLSPKFIGQKKPSHTAWLKVLAENGIPGFVLLAGYVGSFALVGWKRRRQGLLAVGLLAAMCLGFAFMTTEFQSKSLWILAAGATALLNYPPKDHAAAAVGI
jgi:hypothetical protein